MISHIQKNNFITEGIQTYWSLHMISYYFHRTDGKASDKPLRGNNKTLYFFNGLVSKKSNMRKKKNNSKVDII